MIIEGYEETFLYSLLTNKIVLSVVLAIFFAQFIKTGIKLYKTRTFDITKLWETGGMPSSHSSLATALCLSVFLTEGLTTISIVTAFFAMVVIRDAFGLRREAGEQAKVINKIVMDFKLRKRLQIKRLRELVGHTFPQVVMGIILGIFVTLWIFRVDLHEHYPSMEFYFTLITTTIYYSLPGLVANMAPIFVKNHFNWLAIPIDFGIKFRGKRLFGKNKTFRGFLFGILTGMIVGYIQFKVQGNVFFDSISYIDYTLKSALTIGAVFGFAALVGDSIESFFKRQFGIKPGKPFIPFDQLDYALGVIAFSYLFTPHLTWQMILVLLLLGPILSVITTKVGYMLRFRDEKW